MHQKIHITLSASGSPELFAAVRGAFVAQGTSLNAWCNANEINRQTAKKALCGERTSKNAIALIGKIVGAAFGGSA